MRKRTRKSITEREKSIKIERKSRVNIPKNERRRKDPKEKKKSE